MGCVIQNSAQGEIQSEINTFDVEITPENRIFERSNSENLIEILEESLNKSQVPIFQGINHLQQKVDDKKPNEMVFTSVDNSDEEIKIVKSILRKRSDLIHESPNRLRKVQFNLKENDDNTKYNRCNQILKRDCIYQHVTMQQLEEEFQ